MDINDINDIFFDQNPLAESFEVTPPDGTASTIIGIWDTEDNSTSLDTIIINNDSPNVDFRSSDVEDLGIIKRSTVKRIKTDETFYILDQTPDIDGSINNKLSRIIPQ